MDKNTFIKLSEDYFNNFNDVIVKIYELFKEKNKNIKQKSWQVVHDHVGDSALESTDYTMDTLDKTKDLIQCCLLPELKQDLDSIPIEGDHFKSYHKLLEIKLPLLYDYLQQEPNIFVLTGDLNERKKHEIHATLIVLLCEVCCPVAIFKLSTNEYAAKHGERILQNLSYVHKDVEELIFKYYEEKLHVGNWKKQLGAIHSFVKYLEFRYNCSSDLDQGMSNKFLMFCLSVALNIRSFYESHYKALSTTMFLIMLQQGSNDDITSMNIHSVIYDAVFKDIHIMDSNILIDKQWNCLIKCLDFYPNFDSFTWNYLDDMMEVLLRNISLSPDNNASICLLKFVNKLIAYFTINNREFEKLCNKDLKLKDNVNEYRLLANTNTSYTCYRWAKGILQMFIIESHKLLQTTEIAKQMLQEIHKIFILAISPIRLSIIEPHLKTFFEKFISVLMETIKAHKFKADIMQDITLLLETFYFYLQNSEECKKLNIFKQNICDLLKTQVFEKYTTV